MPTCLSISAIFLTIVSSTSGEETFFSVATTTPFVAVTMRQEHASGHGVSHAGWGCAAFLRAQPPFQTPKRAARPRARDL